MRRVGLIGVIYPSFLILIFLTIIILFLSATHTIKGLLYDQTILRLKETSRLLISLVDNQDYPNGRHIDTICSKLTPETVKTRIIFYTARGSIFQSNQLLEAETIKAAKVEATRSAFNGDEASSITKGQSPVLDRMFYSVPITEGGKVVGVVETSLPLKVVNTTLDSTYDTVSFVALLMLLISALMSYYVSVRIDRPLKKIAAAARRYRDLDFSSHPRVTGPSEIRVVSETLNSMSSALQERIQMITRQKRELRTVLDGMVESVLLLDGELVIREINPATERLLKSSYNKIVGKSLIHAVRNSELYDLVSEALEKEYSLERTMSMPEELGPSTLSTRPSARAGVLIHLQVHASVVNEEINDNGRPKTVKRVVVVLNDITRMKNLERIRQDFVANVSHELKTPITSIKGFTETLLEGALEDTETSRSFISIVHQQSERLVAIIEDLLSLSRLEQQEGELERGNTYVSGIIYSAIEVCRTKADEKDTSVLNRCSENCEVYGNNLLIEQAMVNLIDNAVKYSPPSSEVVVDCREEEKGTYLSVRDNGPGIPQRDLPRVFERFYRVDKTRSRELGGTGLGLAIVKHIAISHGGEVTVESTEGEGTEFLIFFPAAEMESAEETIGEDRD